MDRDFVRGGDERVCGSADLARNFVQIADFNNNFSGFVDPINLMDLDFSKKTCADYRFKA